MSGESVSSDSLTWPSTRFNGAAHRNERRDVVGEHVADDNAAQASTEPLIEMSGEVVQASDVILVALPASTEPLIEMSGEAVEKCTQS